MALSKKETREWRSLQAKSKRHGIKVTRVGPANVIFGSTTNAKNRVYAQLGTGHATEIMDARVKVSKMAGRRYANK